MSDKTIGTTVNTPEFRASYVNVFAARMNTLSNKMEYSVTALFPKGAKITALEKACEAAVMQRWGSDKTKWPKNLRSPFRKQEEREKDGELPAGHEAGAVFVTFKTNENPRMPRPGVFDQRNKRIEEVDQSKIYSGCWLVANVTAGAYPKKGVTGIAPGVTFYLNGVQLVRDDEPLSGRPSVEKSFAPIEGFESDDAASEGAGGLFNSLT